jgi:hypothetical protein
MAVRTGTLLQPVGVPEQLLASDPAEPPAAAVDVVLVLDEADRLAALPGAEPGLGGELAQPPGGTPIAPPGLLRGGGPLGRPSMSAGAEVTGVGAATTLPAYGPGPRGSHAPGDRDFRSTPASKASAK